MPELYINDLLGVRFTSHGRSVQDGFDCYGLAIEVSKRLGHELKDLWYEKSEDRVFTENAESMIAANGIIKTDNRELGNLIVFSDDKGNMVHIGVLLDEECFIHAELGGVRITRLENYYRKKWKVYTWQQ
jgi:cell wall-associated NlpC family hydrolase